MIIIHTTHNPLSEDKGFLINVKTMAQMKAAASIIHHNTQCLSPHISLLLFSIHHHHYLTLKHPLLSSPTQSLLCPHSILTVTKPLFLFATLNNTTHTTITTTITTSPLTVLIAKGHDPVHLPSIVHNMGQQVFHIHPHVWPLLHLQAH